MAYAVTLFRVLRPMGVAISGELRIKMCIRDSVSGKPLEYAGELYSEEHKRKFTTEKAGFQVLKDPTDGTRLVLAIDRKPIAEWFKEQFGKLRQNIRRPIQPQRKSKGFKL